VKSHPRLNVKGVIKHFQGVQALAGIDLELQPGEVHALLGQNGSGKSTLIKILAGYHTADRGRAWSDGVEFHLGSASAAREAGLRFIHQDRALVHDLDIAENISLGGRYEGRWWLSDRRERRAARQLLATLELDLDPSRLARTLSPVEETMVAVARALRGEAAEKTILVLDEPTATLPTAEVRQLFQLIKSISARGGTVLYVTHRLQEVFQISDRVTVLRDGRRVVTEKVTSFDEDSLVAAIVGRPLETLYVPPPPPSQDVAIEIRDIKGQRVRTASFEARRGEILGITGLAGSGYEELLHLIFGSDRKLGGEVRIRGAAIPSGQPWEAIRAGIAFAPADRKRLSAIPAWSVRENITLPRLKTRTPLKWLSPREERADVVPWLRRLHVTLDDPETDLSALSGGNQQRVVLARWLRVGAEVLLLEEPTGGVDIGAKQAIYSALVELAGQGVTIVLTSSDAEELCAICDRVLVMRNGMLATELSGNHLTADHILSESIKGSPANTTEAVART
jgi:ribose transport system ATP-binding protein